MRSSKAPSSWSRSRHAGQGNPRGSSTSRLLLAPAGTGVGGGGFLVVKGVGESPASLRQPRKGQPHQRLLLEGLQVGPRRRQVGRQAIERRWVVRRPHPLAARTQRRGASDPVGGA